MSDAQTDVPPAATQSEPSQHADAVIAESAPASEDKSNVESAEAKLTVKVSGLLLVPSAQLLL